MPELFAVKDELAVLVKRFESRNKTEWDEAGTRKSLIDGFWEALGWDTDDPQQVEVEKATKIEDHLRSADYAFLDKGRVRFMVEAKRPAKNLAKDRDAIFQTKLYVWNTPGAFTGILQDFEEFVTFFVMKEPEYGLPLEGLQKKLVFDYKEYADRADELLEHFSRESVIAGSIEKLLPKGKRLEKVTEAINRKFFADLMKWRLEIAKSIAKNNLKLQESDINSAVNHLLNRILFMRVIEDRKIEPYEILHNAFAEWKRDELGPLMAYLIDLFKKLDPKYNGALFSPHIVDNLIIENKPLYNLIKNLYYPKSTYQFSRMPIEVIGNAYEQYLGSVLTLSTTRRVKLVEKSEVRKAGGVYYTPKYIVDYIVEQTVGALVEGRTATPPRAGLRPARKGGGKGKMMTPAEVSKLRILDPACGSGSFLIGAYERIMKYYIDYYTANPKKNKGYLLKDLGGDPKLDIQLKAKILEDNIYGVDIDPQAVDITEFSLYVKMMEGEGYTPSMLAGKLLPDMRDNIKCGNSLIGWDILDMGILPEDPDERQSELDRINPFDWERAFQEIFGKEPLCPSDISPVRGDTEPVPLNKGDVAQRQGVSSGFDAVIGNPPWVQSKFMDRTQKDYFEVVYESALKQFDIFNCFIEKVTSLLMPNGCLGYITPSRFVMNPDYEPLREYLAENISLEEIADVGEHIFQGVEMPSLLLFFKNTKPSRKNQIFVIVEVEDLETGKWVSYNIPQERFQTEQGHLFTIYEPEEIRALTEKMQKEAIQFGGLVDNARGVEIGKKHESISLSSKNGYKPFLAGEDIGRYYISGNRWIDPNMDAVNYKTESLYNGTKILIRKTGTGINATLDTDNYWVIQVIYIFKKKRNKYNERYLLGLINSQLMTIYYFAKFGEEHKQAFPHLRQTCVKQLPIRTIDFDNPDDVANHDRMVKLVEDMLALNKRLHKEQSPSRIKSIEGQIAHTDRKIDELVYELYGLTEEEIGIVEGS